MAVAYVRENLYPCLVRYVTVDLGLEHEASDFKLATEFETVGEDKIGTVSITYWDEAKLGAQPSYETVMAHETAWQTEYDAAQYQRDRGCELAKKQAADKEFEAHRELNEHMILKFDALVEAVKNGDPITDSLKLDPTAYARFSEVQAAVAAAKAKFPKP